MKGGNLPITAAFLRAQTVTGVGEEGGSQTMHPLLAAGLKVPPFKGRSGKSKGWEDKRCEVILKGSSVRLY